MEYIARFLSAFWDKFYPNAILFVGAALLIVAWVLHRVDVIEANEAMWMIIGGTLATISMAVANMTTPPGPPAGVPVGIVEKILSKIPDFKA